MAALQVKQVYSEATMPENTTPLASKLVLDIKRDEYGNVDKYKARLVAKGFRQVAGRDYDEVFAPTGQHVTIRVLLALASAQDLEVEQLDVRTAFLNGELSEDVYLRLPTELGGNI
jgi:Reverse transcriptase (RNA-dependent DNA polymerase)